MPRILFIAMTESVHTARWLNEMNDLNWDVHIFPSLEPITHPAIKNVTIHGLDFRPEKAEKSLHSPGAFPFSLPYVSDKANIVLQRLRNHLALQSGKDEYEYSVRQLIRVIKKIKPDIIHTLEMQHAGYLALKAKEEMGNIFPPWIYTPWGNDIFFFGRLPDHTERIKKVLGSCNYYGPKSERDIRLGKEYGFKGEFLEILPGNGGLDTTQLKNEWQPGKSSNRKLILVKGYQGIMGRALVALRALELCYNELKDYSIVVYSASEEVKIKSQLLSHDLGMQITVLPSQPHDQMLSLYGRARLSIGLSISDGVSNSLLESMALGAFPIESNTSCADEWIIYGENGLIVPPEDPDCVADAIRVALNDDQLIDSAAEKNFKIAQERVDISIIKPKILSLYQNVYKDIQMKKHKQV